MQGGLSPETDRSRRRLVDEQIIRPASLDARVQGAAGIFLAFQEVLEPMLGALATRAVFSRAVTLAKREQPRLGKLPAPETGFDVRRLREDLGGASELEVQEALITMIDELFFVVHGLLGKALIWLLPEVEARLKEQQIPPCGDEEDSR